MPDLDMTAVAPEIDENNLGSRVKIIDDQDKEKISCGYGTFRPAALQRCNNSKAALVFISAFAFIQGMVVNGINNVNTSTIERRFKLPSSQVAIISSSYDIAAGLSVLFIGHWGRSGHKPRMLAIACALMGIGSLIMVIPHYATGLYEPDDETPPCPTASEAAVENAVCSSSNVQNFLYVFILGQLLHGLGGAALYCLSPVYIDDNVSQKWAPVHLGIFYAFSAIGPAIGYLGGGQLLDIYVDTGATDISKVNIKTTDPRWVGAWWIGFIISGILALILALVLFCFGFETPAAAEVRANRVSEVYTKKKSLKPEQYDTGTTWRDIPKTTCLILKNPPFIFITLAGAITLMIATGFATFIAKYIQNQFGLSASMAATYAGLVLIPGAALGMLAGGFIMNRFNFKVRGMLRMCCISMTIGVLASPGFFIRCESTKITGVTVEYGNTNNRITEVALDSSCHSMCTCSTKSRRPVCGVDGVEYFNPCYAGCQELKIEGSTSYYWNCSCIAESVLNLGKTVDNAKAMGTESSCENSCNLLAPFLLVLFVCIFGVMLTNTPALSATMRCVPESTRSFALSIQWVILRFAGSVPGPIIFGVVIDSQCTVWQKTCGSNGSCWVYDNELMSVFMFVMSVIMIAIIVIFFVLALVTYKPPPPSETDDTQKENPATGNSVSKVNQSYVEDAKEPSSKITEL